MAGGDHRKQARRAPSGGRRLRTSPRDARQEYLSVLEAIIDGMGLDILATDPSGRILLMNRRLAGRIAPGGDPTGKPLLEVLPELKRETEGVCWSTVIATNVLGEGRTIDSPHQPLRGRRYDIQAFPLRRGKALLGAALVLNDITDRMRTEREHLREARTSSLANLSASVAHEIRNPLNSIALNLQLMREQVARLGKVSPGSEASEAIASADTVLSEIRRLDRIIKEFLQFSKPPQPVFRMDDPNEAVLAAMRLLEGNVRKAGVDVTLELGALPTCLIDRERLSEAIYNLALNAVQAMADAPPSARREMTLRTRPDGADVVLEIADTGPGIPPEVRARVFDLFFTTRREGTGLGLPYANTVVAAHQGSLALESRPGEGTIATIRLPGKILA